MDKTRISFEEAKTQLSKEYVDAYERLVAEHGGNPDNVQLSSLNILKKEYEQKAYILGNDYFNQNSYGDSVQAQRARDQYRVSLGFGDMDKAIASKRRKVEENYFSGKERFKSIDIEKLTLEEAVAILNESYHTTYDEVMKGYPGGNSTMHNKLLEQHRADLADLASKYGKTLDDVDQLVRENESKKWEDYQQGLRECAERFKAIKKRASVDGVQISEEHDCCIASVESAFGICAPYNGVPFYTKEGLDQLEKQIQEFLSSDEVVKIMEKRGCVTDFSSTGVVIDTSGTTL